MASVLKQADFRGSLEEVISDEVAPISDAFAPVAKRDLGWRHVSVEAIANSGHWVIDEQPAIVAELFERYAVP